DATGGGDGHRVVAEIGEAELLSQQPPVGARVRAHAPRPARGQLAQLGPEAAALVEEGLRLVALQPGLEQLQAVGAFAYVGERHLVGPPRALRLVALDFLRPGPALG